MFSPNTNIFHYYFNTFISHNIRGLILSDFPILDACLLHFAPNSVFLPQWWFIVKDINITHIY